MNRRANLIIAAAAALAIVQILASTPMRAQNPPSERELQIYAGLHAAAANGDVAEIERLIADGERPDIQDSHSRTPLIVAAYRRQYKAAQALLRLGANPNARDGDRFDILTIAVTQNDRAGGRSQSASLHRSVRRHRVDFGCSPRSCRDGEIAD
jgi:ankyrin repeat protein